VVGNKKWRSRRQGLAPAVDEAIARIAVPWTWLRRRQEDWEDFVTECA